MQALAFVLATGLLAAQLPGTGAPAEEAKPVRQVSGPCATPKAAVTTWLSNLQPDNYNEGRAALCTVVPQGMTSAEVKVALVHLKRILDARGVYVRVDELPEDPDYRDGVSDQHRVPVSTLMPEIYLVRSGDQWVLSSETLKAVESLYAQTFPLDVQRLIEPLPKWMKTSILGVQGWQVLGLAILILLGFIARAIVTYFVVVQVTRLFDKLKITWGRDLIQGNATPLGTLALAGVVGLGVSSLGLSVGFARITLLAVRVTAAVSVVMLLYRLVDIVAAWMEHRAEKTETKLDDQLVPLVRRGLRVITVLGGIVFVLQNLEVNVGSLLATLGIGTLAFALAAQDTVKNLFGSITIFLDKPFQIGDWVVVAGVEGVIEEVGFRSTRVRTFYNSLVTVPNGKFTDAIVDNYGLRQYRRCSIRLSLTYDTTPEQMEAFCDGVRAVITAHPDTRKDYFEVHFAGYGDSGLEVMLYFFFEVGSWSEELRARHEVYLDFWRLARDLGVSFAFPTQTIHVESQAQPEPRAHSEPPVRDDLKKIVDAYGPDGDNVIPPGQRVHPGFYAPAANPRGDMAMDAEAGEG
jgi:MscS family membrane protein